MLNRKFLVNLIITGIFLNGLVSYLTLIYNNHLELLNSSNEDISRYEEKFKNVRNDLPHNGLIGYFTNETINYSDPDNTPVARFFVAQYALSPLILVNSTNQSFVVGNLHQADIDSLDYSGKGLALVKDYGNGIFLFREGK